jgi:alanyl-tRNA synthetase
LISSAKIRQDFLDFFASKGHTIVPSASVIPADDPTLLFTNAGMNQFKDVFLGTGKRSYSRCANTQKCIRVSGKHNDLEEVGHDNFHHTFFEMLGNWSFGDYYKKEAIIWAWELLTDVWKINKNKLWVTVFENDEEAFELWKTYTDIANSHILKFGVKDNFWEMGDTGPCGPCSEIHYDFTSNGCSASDINSGNPDVMEIWNLVFIQYNRDSNGELNDLPQKHIDTGMGFERIVRVLQNTSSNYLTDIFSPLINELINITGKDYYGNFIAPMNVISDHIRTLTFAIADGAIPSNESRGYVLRRILRRAARYGRNLDMHKPFIFKLVDVLVNTMGNVFPEIIDKKDFIKEVIKSEEESFNLTLDKGIALFNEEIQKLKTQNSVYFSGEAAFKLHDTYGFPIDLTQLMAKESGFDVDINTFNQKMQDAKNLSRLNLSDSAPQNFELINLSRIDTANLIYNPWVNTNKIETYIIGTEKISDNEIALMLANNPFYKESGGQVSDLGSIIINGYNFNILNVLTQNIVTTEYNEIFKPGLKIIAHLDFTRRLDIQRNHSATHLVHEALKRVLGPHIKQMGSYLDNQILRFDFPHFHKLTENEITEIENIVNSKISENIEVYDIKKMPFEEAKKIPNIKMFFGEKYGEFVRVVLIY